MKGILYFVCALVLTAGAHSCRTVTDTATMRDTLTITRDSVVYIHTRDTLTIQAEQERDIVRYVYDTAQRVREVVKIQYRDRLKAEQGSAQTAVIHDTITVQAGAQMHTTHTIKPKKSVSPWAWLLVALFVVACVALFYLLVRLNSKLPQIAQDNDKVKENILTWRHFAKRNNKN